MPDIILVIPQGKVQNVINVIKHLSMKAQWAEVEKEHPEWTDAQKAKEAMICWFKEQDVRCRNYLEKEVIVNKVDKDLMT